MPEHIPMLFKFLIISDISKCTLQGPCCIGSHAWKSLVLWTVWFPYSKQNSQYWIICTAILTPFKTLRYMIEKMKICIIGIAFIILWGGDITFPAVFFCFSGVMISSWTRFWDFGFSDICTIAFFVSPSTNFTFSSVDLAICQPKLWISGSSNGSFLLQQMALWADGGT